MKSINRWFIVVWVVMLAVAVSCKREGGQVVAAVSDSAAEVAESVGDELPEPVVPPQDSVAEPEQPAKTTVKRQQPKASGTPRKAEQLYVRGYDANGAVWGYVTMRGDRGSGTIHDSEENHFSVTCTRHGNELYAVDHNGRQYVLRCE